MTGPSIQDVERYLAEGDYRRALEALEKAGPLDPEVSQLVQSMVDRMKKAASQEFDFGRWSVAEDISSFLEKHQRLLTPEEQAECRRLFIDIHRSRSKEGQVQAVVQAAAALAAQGRFPESREIALRGMRNCSDPHLVARLRRLLHGLPHPLGSLLYGFDSPLEVEQFVRPSGGSKVVTCFQDEPGLPEELEEFVAESREMLGGGMALVTCPKRGAGVSFLDPPADWTRYKELSVLVRLVNPPRGKLSVYVGDPKNAWVYDADIRDRNWNQIRMSLTEFHKRGNPRWEAVSFFAVASAMDEPVEILLDEIRIKADLI